MNAAPSIIENSKEQPANVAITNVDMIKYPFRRWFQETLQSTLLEELHLQYQVDVANFDRLTDQLCKRCQKNIDGLRQILKSYSDEVIEPLVGRMLARQENPTVRIYLAVTDPKLQFQRRAMSASRYTEFLETFYSKPQCSKVFHRDADYGVDRRAINLWLPVTAAFGTNSLWIGTEAEHGRDAVPVHLEIGQALLFDGANRWHGTLWNTSGHTRVSFDWRLVPENHPGFLSIPV